MNDDAERIRKHMRHIRRDVGADVRGIVDGAKQLSDWRYYVKTFPWACVGSALALGYLIVPPRRGKFGVEEAGRDGRAGYASAGAAALAGRGIAGRLLAIGGPIVARKAASYLAEKWSNAQASADASDSRRVHEH